MKSQKDIDGMINSVDPDQTARLGSGSAPTVYTSCVPIIRTIQVVSQRSGADGWITCT